MVVARSKIVLTGAGVGECMCFSYMQEQTQRAPDNRGDVRLLLDENVHSRCVMFKLVHCIANFPSPHTF